MCMRSKIKRRELLKASVLAGATGVLAGCTGGNNGSGGGNSNSSSSNNSQSSSGSQTSITYYDRHEFGFKPAFEESHSNINIDVTMAPPDNSYKKLVAQVSAGTAPEVIGLGVTKLGRFADLGALTSLDSFYNQLDYTDDFLDVIRDSFVTYTDTIYAAPFWIDNSLYYYNKNHFKKVGLDPENPPKTWKEFRAAAEALTTDGRKGVAMGLNGSMANFFWLPYLWANGGKLVKENGKETGIGEQPAIDALKYWVDMVEKDYTTNTTTIDWNTLHQKFANEKASMLHSGGYGIGYVKEKNPELYKNMGTAVIPKPQGGSHSSYIGGNCITISRQAKQNQSKFKAAKEFVQWVNTKPGMRLIFEKGYFPGRKSAFKMEIAQERSRLLGPFKDALEIGNVPPITPKIAEINPPLRSAVVSAAQGNTSPKKALQNAAKEINEILQE